MSVPAPSEPIVVQDAEKASKLQAIAASGACENGRVVAMDFASVRTAIGDRWAFRVDDVHSRIEREIQRQASRSTTFLRITDSEYLVSFTDTQGAAAQMLAFNIMEQLLHHFLGKCDPGDLIVKCVSAVTADGVEMRPLSRAEVEQQHLSGSGLAPPASAPVIKPSCTLIEGPAERLSFRVEPQDITHIASGLNIGTRMAVSLYKVGSGRQLSFREECSLSTPTLLQISLQTIDSLRGIMARTRQPAVFVLPMFLQTMTSSRGRLVILDELRQFRSFDQRRLIVEITGIERGTPSSRLMETGALLRPFCRAVTGRAQLERSALNAISGARLSGIGISVREMGSSQAQRAAGLLAAGQAARNLATMIMAVDIADPVDLNVCAVAGFTHATVTPQ